jgi:hypothetical protein
VRCPPSAHSSRVSGVLTSVSSAPAGTSPGSARPIHGGETSSPPTGPTCRAFPTCEPSGQMRLPSTSSQVDSPASPSVSRDAGAPRTTSAGSGPSSPEWFATYDPDSCSWRTSQGCLPGMEEWETYSGTWPRSGMTRSGIAYRLPSSAPPISAFASGLLPTPTRESYGYNQQESPGATVEPSLQTMASKALWLTPKASPSGPGVVRATRAGSGGDDLATAVARAMWLTPKASDATKGHSDARPSSKRGGGGSSLNEQAGGPLNPMWVEWLMGFPLGWTDLQRSGTP